MLKMDNDKISSGHSSRRLNKYDVDIFPIQKKYEIEKIYGAVFG